MAFLVELRVDLVVVACWVDPEAAFQVEHREHLVVAFQVEHREYLVVASPEVRQGGLVVAYPEVHLGLLEVAFQAAPCLVVVLVGAFLEEPHLEVHHVAACLVVDPHLAVDHVVAFLVVGLDLEVHRENLVVVRQAGVLLVDLVGNILA